MNFIPGSLFHQYILQTGNSRSIVINLKVKLSSFIRGNVFQQYILQARQKSGVSRRSQESGGLREELCRRIEDESGRERCNNKGEYLNNKGEAGLRLSPRRLSNDGRLSPRRVNIRRFAFASSENR